MLMLRQQEDGNVEARVAQVSAAKRKEPDEADAVKEEKDDEGPTAPKKQKTEKDDSV
jgi:hypothetical protein